jgi:hypothetical protein
VGETVGSTARLASCRNRRRENLMMPPGLFF